MNLLLMAIILLSLIIESLYQENDSFDYYLRQNEINSTDPETDSSMTLNTTESDLPINETSETPQNDTLETTAETTEATTTRSEPTTAGLPLGDYLKLPDYRYKVLRNLKKSYWSAYLLMALAILLLVSSIAFSFYSQRQENKRKIIVSSRYVSDKKYKPKKVISKSIQ